MCLSIQCELMFDFIMFLLRPLEQVDRDTIRRNEFEWLLRSRGAQHASEDLLPPRFHDLASSFLANKHRAVEDESSTSLTRITEGVALPKVASSASSSSATVSESAFEVEGVDKINDGESFEHENATKRTQLRHWLEKQLVECVAPQAARVAAGLREAIPYGVLALLQPRELQAFLAGEFKAVFSVYDASPVKVHTSMHGRFKKNRSFEYTNITCFLCLVPMV